MADIQPINIQSTILKLIEDKRMEEAKELLNAYTDKQVEDDHKELKNEIRIVESLASTTVAELLERFPEGFVVSPEGHLFITLAAVSSMQYLSIHYPTPPIHGGYIVVSVPNYQEGDEKFGVNKE